MYYIPVLDKYNLIKKNVVSIFVITTRVCDLTLRTLYTFVIVHLSDIGTD